MSLEDVKVGDDVWRERLIAGQRERHHLPVTRVTKTRIYSNNLAWRRTKGHSGWQDAGDSYGCNEAVAGRITGIATPEEITAWEAEQAQKKADAEARETAQQQAYQEQRSRMFALLHHLNVDSIVSPTANVIVFERDGHMYRIEETE